MNYLGVRNWDKHQHYKKKDRPHWIKLYVSMLRDDELRALPIPTRLLWDQLLLLAGEYANAIPNDPELIAKLTGMPTRTVRQGLEELMKGRWLREKQTPRVSRRASIATSMPEKEKEKENPPTPLFGNRTLALKHLIELRERIGA